MTAIVWPPVVQSRSVGPVTRSQAEPRTGTYDVDVSAGRSVV